MTHRRMFCSVLVVALFAVPAVTAPGEAAATARYPCKAKSARLLKKNGYARVFMLRKHERSPSGHMYHYGDFIGCDGRADRWINLARFDMDPHMKPVRIAGKYAAFGFDSSCGGCDHGFYSMIKVVDLQTGHIVYRKDLGDDEHFPGYFDDIALRSSGAVAFIYDQRWPGSHYRRVVVRHDANGTEILDGGSIRTQSLELNLNRSRITWKNGGARKSATLR